MISEAWPCLIKESIISETVLLERSDRMAFLETSLSMLAEAGLALQVEKL